MNDFLNSDNEKFLMNPFHGLNDFSFSVHPEKNDPYMFN